jgi:hypothetical protein
MTPKATGSKPTMAGNNPVATIRSGIKTRAPASEVWSAIRDIGALHTRLVPGFVTDTKLEPGARVVTFVNGVVLREPIVTLDDEARRLVWTHEGGRARHYNGALEVSELADGMTSVVWTADFLPDDISAYMSQAIEAGMAAMQRSLDRLAA